MRVAIAILLLACSPASAVSVDWTNAAVAGRYPGPYTAQVAGTFNTWPGEQVISLQLDLVDANGTRFGVIPGGFNQQGWCGAASVPAGTYHLRAYVVLVLNQQLVWYTFDSSSSGGTNITLVRVP